MNEHDLLLDCRTCVAANTTACGECLVPHVMANDEGPIQLVVVPRLVEVTPAERAVDMLSRAGLLDESPEWVSREEFEAGLSPQFA